MSRMTGSATRPGFSFIADSNLGVYEIGDSVPIMHTVIRATLPIPAKLKLLRNGAVVAEANDANFRYEVERNRAITGWKRG